jgi:hypothetical protein
MCQATKKANVSATNVGAAEIIATVESSCLSKYE